MPPFQLKLTALAARTEIVYDGTILRVGKKQLVVDQIAWFLWFTVIVNGMTIHNQTWGDNSTTIKMKVERGVDAAGAKLKANDVAHILRQFCARNIEPRLIDAYTAHIRTGHPATVGKMTLTQQGFQGPSLVMSRQKTFGWASLRDVNYSNGNVIVTVEDGGKLSKAISVPMKEPNAVMLPNLLGHLYREFARQ